MPQKCYIREAAQKPIARPLYTMKTTTDEIEIEYSITRKEYLTSFLLGSYKSKTLIVSTFVGFILLGLSFYHLPELKRIGHSTRCRDPFFTLNRDCIFSSLIFVIAQDGKLICCCTTTSKPQTNHAFSIFSCSWQDQPSQV